MKILKNVVMLLFMILLSPVEAQNSSESSDAAVAKNAILASFGGSGILYSVMYERIVLDLPGDCFMAGIKGGIGSGIRPVSFPEEFGVPLGMFLLYGKKSSHLDCSMIIKNYFRRQADLETMGQSKELQVLLIPSLTYRFQRHSGGIVARAGLSVIMHPNSVTNTFSPWVDISLGWAF